jgi:hypothetical protein
MQVRQLSAEGGKGNKMRPLLTALVLACLSTAALAQTPAPKKLVAQAKPKEPMGCKVVGTVKSTKLWAGDCVAASELHGAVTAETPSLPERASEAIPPDAKQ